VHPHIVQIDDKAGVSTRADAAVFAIKHDLIHPPSAA
jgi:DNA-binding NarL/FixJ family response regulator